MRFGARSRTIPEAMEGMPRWWSPRAILAVIVLVGAALRLNGIDRAELWYDELQTVQRDTASDARNGVQG
jgi:hypothetical protein